MERKQNIIIFSAGETDRSQKVALVARYLEAHGIRCSDWRSLFTQAHQPDQIALLPTLTKKIPSFDFALIFGEGVDRAHMRESEDYAVMRDNVVFELGMCVMALGAERVILFSDDDVRIPEDLTGIESVGVKHITYKDWADVESALNQVVSTIHRAAGRPPEIMQVDEIVAHVVRNAKIISPVFVGAAVSSAEAYFTNFIVRLLENVDKQFHARDHSGQGRPFPAGLKVRILLPEKAGGSFREEVRRYYPDHGLEEFLLDGAGVRSLSFHGTFDPATGDLTVVDIPTSITASASIVNSILNLDSDDEFDGDAQDRFVTKEMDVYEYTLKKLCTPEVARKRLEDTPLSPEAREAVAARLAKVEILREDLART